MIQIRLVASVLTLFAALGSSANAASSEPAVVANPNAVSMKHLLSLDSSGFLSHELSRAKRFHDPNVEDWPFYSNVQAPHQIRVIDDGLVDLEQRLQMIERANSTIEYMTFIFEGDVSGKMILKALIKKAAQGVKVRILLDWFNDSGKPGITEAMVATMKSALVSRGVSADNFELRYYNKGEVFPDPIKIDHRNHAKLLIVDGQQLLMGGRNTADAYFGMLAKGYDYFDRDLLISSQNPDPHMNAAKQASVAFDLYWQNMNWTMAAAKVAPDQSFLKELSSPDTDLRAQLQSKIAAVSPQTLPVYTVSNVTLVLDRPGHDSEDRRITPILDWRLANTNRYVLIENYTVPLSSNKFGIVSYLSEVANIPIILLTNSIHSADGKAVAIYSEATEIKILRSLQHVWAFNVTGQPFIGQLELVPWTKDAIFADHTKSMVTFSEQVDSTFVGSYNFDPRSENINNESIAIIDDPVIAQVVAKSIRNRTLQADAMTVDKDGNGWYAGTKEPIKIKGLPFLNVLADLVGLRSVVEELY